MLIKELSVHIDKQSSEKRGNWLRRAFLSAVLAGEIAVWTVGGTAVGYFLDEYFKTSPLIMISGLLVGFISGVTLFLLTIKNTKFRR